VFALQRLRHFLYGTHFELRTDHRALTFMFTQKHANTMLQSWLDVLLEFSFTVVHCPGVLMVLPDALSRIYRELRWEQQASSTDARLRAVRSGDSTDLRKPLAQYIMEFADKKCPPVLERRLLLERKHAEGHFHAKHLYSALLDEGYFWPGMRSQCEQLVASCDDCLRFNVGRAGFAPLRFVNARYPFEHVAIDLGTFSVTSPRGMNFILVVVCVFSRFLLLRPLRSKAAEEVARVLWQIMCDFGTPKIIQSDNGSEFVNSVVRALVQLMGVDHRLVAAYNPRANGVAERFVGVAKKVLLKIMGGNIKNFDLFLPAAQRAINLKLASRTGSVPFALFFCRPANAFADFRSAGSEPFSEEEVNTLHQRVLNVVYPELLSMVEARQRKQSTKHNAGVKDVKAAVAKRRIPLGSTVMIKDMERRLGTDPFWLGPFVVREVTRNGCYRVQDERGELLARKVPRDQLKLIVAARAGTAPVVSGDVYLVDSIVAHRGVEAKREYLIHWRGFSEAERTWEPAANIQPSLLRDYWNQTTSKAKTTTSKAKATTSKAKTTTSEAKTTMSEAKTIASKAKTISKAKAATSKAKTVSSKAEDTMTEAAAVTGLRRSSRGWRPSAVALESMI
jgi:hypothetical protein